MFARRYACSASTAGRRAIRRQSSVFNLSLALSSRSDPNRRSPIELDIATESAVLERNLGHYDCVMLSNVAQFTASEARVLDNYLVHGGSLVFFLGDRVIADNYNSVLAGRAAEGSRQILPARLIAVAKNPGGRPRSAGLPASDRAEIPRSGKGGIARIAHRPVLQSQTAGGGPRRASPGRRRRCNAAATGQGRGAQSPTAPHSPAEVVLALSNGDPLIVAQPVRRGRVVLVTTSADASWGLLPKWGTYEPLVKEILAWCTAGQAQPRNVAVGDPLESALRGNAGPDAACRSSVPTVNAARCRWRSRAITAPGATTIR